MEPLRIITRRRRRKLPTAPAVLSEHCQIAYQNRRVWSRTETARWLNDRRAPVFAILRRRPGKWPTFDCSIGYWMKDNAPELFDAVHATLLAARDDTAREALLPQNVLP
jgi:hypothetical protein